MSFTLAAKDPDEREAYEHDWGPRLADDDYLVIVAGTLGQLPETQSPYVEIVEGDAEFDGFETDNNQTKVWLIGGTSNTNTTYLVRITTAAGRRLEEEFILPIRNR